MTSPTIEQLQAENARMRQAERERSLAGLPADQRALYLREQELEDKIAANAQVEERMQTHGKELLAKELSFQTRVPVEKLQAAESVAQMHDIARRETTAMYSDPAKLREMADLLDASAAGKPLPVAPAAAPGTTAPGATAPVPLGASPGAPAPMTPSALDATTTELSGKGSDKMTDWLSHARQEAAVPLRYDGNYGAVAPAPAPATLLI